MEHEPSNNKKDKAPDVTEDFPIDQLIIWRKREATVQEVRDWIAKIEITTQSENILNVNRTCGSCDDSLMLLTGPGIKTLIQTKAIDGKVTAGVSSPNTGEDGPVYYSLNYRVKHKKPRISPISFINRLSPRRHPGKTIKVAVFDTGIDRDELYDFAYHSPGPSCIKGANSGWNFIMNNNDIHDDDDIKHGTIVTRLITDQVTRHGQNQVEILPVKTHDANGVGDLFSILCAFAYAKERGVKIINASFGFYTPRRKFSPDDDPEDPNVLLLRKYIEYYLTNNKILLVSAAGNTDGPNLKNAFKEHGWPYIPDDPRDLNQVAFYPASLARNPGFPNVIAVTTVNIENGMGRVSPEQNFSNSVIDIGVIADAVSGEDYVFNNPILNHRETVEGSSFAAPIVTGILCANYDKIEEVINRDKFEKEDIWKELGSQLVGTNRSLADEIKGGRIMRGLK